jgi:hypothetical protein
LLSSEDDEVASPVVGGTVVEDEDAPSVVDGTVVTVEDEDAPPVVDGTVVVVVVDEVAPSVVDGTVVEDEVATPAGGGPLAGGRSGPGRRLWGGGVEMPQLRRTEVAALVIASAWVGELVGGPAARAMSSVTICCRSCTN